MVKFWRRKVQQDTRNAQPAHNAQPAPGPADLAAWAREADVSRLSPQTRREAEDYLNKYRHMNLELSQQMGWRVMAAIEAQVTPSPPPFAQPLDVIATVLALRRKQPGTGLSSRHRLQPRSARLPVCPRVTVAVPGQPLHRARGGHDPLIRDGFESVLRVPNHCG